MKASRIKSMACYIRGKRFKPILRNDDTKGDGGEGFGCLGSELPGFDTEALSAPELKLRRKDGKEHVEQN